MGKDFDIEAFAKGQCELPAWFQWPADLADPQVRAKLVQFLRICDEGGFRPFQHHVGLAPNRYRALMGSVYGRAAEAKIVSFARSCRHAAARAERGRPRPAGCECCAEISRVASVVGGKDIVFRGLHMLFRDDEDDPNGEPADENAPISLTIKTSMGLVELVLDHLEFTPVFRHWLCNGCNTLLVAKLDQLPLGTLTACILRAFEMAHTVAGGVAPLPHPEGAAADSYRALLKACLAARPADAEE